MSEEHIPSVSHDLETLALDYLENAERFEFEVRYVVTKATTTEGALIALQGLRTVQTIYAVDEDEDNKNIWYVIVMFAEGVTTQILCERN